jgi:hypothetical protein
MANQRFIFCDFAVEKAFGECRIAFDSGGGQYVQVTRFLLGLTDVWIGFQLLDDFVAGVVGCLR